MPRRALPLSLLLLILNAPDARSGWNMDGGRVDSKTLENGSRYRLNRMQIENQETFHAGRVKFFWQMRLYAFEGNYLESAEWNLFSRPLWESRGKMRWQASFHKERRQEWLFRAQRAGISAPIGPVEFSIGRLRNALGSSRVFLSPFDRLDALPPPWAFDGERQASDTAAVSLSPGMAWRMRGGYLWDARNSDYRSYLSFRWLTREGFEISATGGRLEPGTDAAGVALQKSSAWGEWRWETVKSRQETEAPVLTFTGPIPQITIQKTEKKFVRHLVFWEKAFENDWLASLEYFYNGAGQSREATYDLVSLLNGRDFYLARDYWGVSLRKTLSALWSAGFQGIVNQTDGSISMNPRLEFTSPSASWSAIFKAGFQNGTTSSEYGRLPDRFQLEAKLYF